MFCEFKDLCNESDVEQKFIVPLLMRKIPEGLGFSSNNFKTKKFLKHEIIDKGKHSKSYAPDYLIHIEGIPLAVIEAKHPNESINEGYREAQLYAQVINAAFPHDLNPCNKIIACNGRTLLAGYCDYQKYEFEINFDNFVIGDTLFEKLHSFLNYDVLKEEWQIYFKKLRTQTPFIKPITKIGSKRIQNENICYNTFGEKLVLNFQQVFTPDSEQEKLAIVQNAYVYFKKREHHVDPIYKIIRRDISRSNTQHQIIDNDIPIELSTEIQSISKSQLFKETKKSLILLIGSVGSGKSTFIRHFQYVSSQKGLLPETVWLYIDMNSARSNSKEKYDWIADKIYNSLREKYSDEDFESLEMMCRVYHEEIKDFENGLGRILGKDSIKYKEEEYQIIKQMHQNSEKRLRRYIDFLSSKYHQTCIVVLDNCDKQTAEEQLATFSVAQWLREYFPFLIIMPLRDSTYDTYQSQPPLDTVMKNLTFRIDPPDFFKVLQLRLKYILRLEKEQMGHQGYALPGNKYVELKKDELIGYFKSILNSIRNDSFAKDLFYGLAGRNIRKGIELFLNFCRSGHVPAENFLKMRITEGEYVLPPHLILNALMRGNRKYYSSEESCIKNLFASEYLDCPPDPFVRLDILMLLNNIPEKDKLGFTVQDMLDSLSMGIHKADILIRELKRLISDGLVVYESNAPEFDMQGQIFISVCGKQYIHLLSNINYLSACSEDIYYQDNDLALLISERMRYLSEKFKPLVNAYLNAKDMVMYLEKYKTNMFVKIDKLPLQLSIDTNQLLNLSLCHQAIETFEKKNSSLLNALNSVKNEDIIGKELPFKVTHIEEYGVFGNLGDGINGFIPRKTLSEKEFVRLDSGVKVQVKVLEYITRHVRFTVKFIKFLEEESL